MNYVFGIVKPGRYACRLKSLQGVDDDYELHQGLSRAETWPSDGQFEMNEAYPDRLQLEDVVFNRNNVLVISEKLRAFLEVNVLKNNEALPVRLINHKGRAVDEPYFILHQLELQDCIDEAQSEVRRNPLDPDSFMSVKKLVIDESKIDPEVRLFRMATYPALPLFRRDLADDIQKGGFTGIEFGEIADWAGK
jgi:hypothetical protein